MAKIVSGFKRAHAKDISFLFLKGPVVDTHVHRVSQRIGLIGPKVNPTAAHTLLLNLLPPDPHYPPD